MADVTNLGVAGPGGQLSGDASRAAAIRRLQKQQLAQGQQRPGQVQAPKLQNFVPKPPKERF